MDEEYLLISGIQHFCFCRRQWALIHLENAWDENMYTAEGRIMHERVHDENITTKKNGIITLRGLPVKSNHLMITGVCDAVELIPDDEGITLRDRKGKWRIHPIEYKRGKPKTHDSDRLQLAAQCICLEEMLSCKIEKGSLYYGSTRRREEIVIDDSIREKLNAIVSEMWGYYRRQYTPKVKAGKMCSSCSLVNICMPALMEKKDVSKYIWNHIYEDNT